MKKRQLTGLLTISLICAVLVASSGSQVSAWSNGGWSADPSHPDYGTHDWIAQHALDWLPTQEKQFFISNLASYLYGTELPDNVNTPDGIGDTAKHHVYFFANGSLQDDAAAVRAKQEYANAQVSFSTGNFSAAVEHLGMVAHYVSDVAVFGHVMGAATVWGTEKHHSDYEDYVLSRTDTFDSEFSNFLTFDGNLTTTSPYDATVTVAWVTTFDAGKGYNCVWMDQHYNWSDPTYRNRCGESLNIATNAVADVLHAFYSETVAPSSTPTQTATASITPTPSATSAPTSTFDSDSVTNSSPISNNNIHSNSESDTFYSRIHGRRRVFVASCSCCNFGCLPKKEQSSEEQELAEDNGEFFSQQKLQISSFSLLSP